MINEAESLSSSAKTAEMNDLESQLREALSSRRFEVIDDVLDNKLEKTNKILVKEYCG
jgi:hypothetical protein